MRPARLSIPPPRHSKLAEYKQAATQGQSKLKDALWYNHFMDYLSVLLTIIIVFLCLYGCYFVVQISLDAHKKNIVAGKEAMIDEEGTVVSIHHDKIIVRVLGELWSAECHERLHLHQPIKVIKLKGLILSVKPIHQS